MSKGFITLVFATMFLFVVGCGGGSDVPTQDLGPADTIGQDTAPDTIIPTDIPAGDEQNHDTKVPDVPVGDNPTPDVPVEDVPIEDNPPVDNGPDSIVPDLIPTDEGTDSTTPVTCTSNSECDGDKFCKVATCGESGLCTTKPALCLMPMVPENLCACDGLHYDSECFANMAGTSVGAGADCGSSTTCSNDSGCEATEYCLKAACGDAEGTCALKATMCPIFPNPVCGCDGQMYDNPCSASMNGVSVDTTGDSCAAGDVCTNNAGCTAGFCFKTSCEASAEGTCEVAPAFCLIIGDGVCGCDGNTYTNECLAKQAGVSIDPTGDACDTTETCASNSDCTSTQYCKKTTCTSTEGICTAISLKPCFDTEDPVCGCDGVIYPNACKAAKCRVNTQKATACASTDTCGKMDLCMKGDYCLTASCGISGVCMPVPKACETATYQVCGCDDVTYKNFCEAAKAGMSIKDEGRCGVL